MIEEPEVFRLFFCAPGMVHVYTVQVRNTEGAVGVSLRQGRLPQGRV